MNEQEARTSILQMAQGAIQERVDYEVAKAIDNILDPNTDPTKKRRITLTIEFQPDGDRQTVFVSCGASSKLCPTNPVSTSLYITGDGHTGEVMAVEMAPNVPGQQNMFGVEQEPASVLKLARNVKGDAE